MKRAIQSIILIAGVMLFGAEMQAAELHETSKAAMGGAGEAVHAVAEHAHKALPPNAEEIGHLGPLPITNSMVLTWVVAFCLILLAHSATKNIQAVPGGLQNFWEWLVEGLHNFLEGIIGRELVKKTFWFFATIFIMIVSCNWFGLIPGVGTVGWGDPHGHDFQPWLRGANADLNMTFGMAMIFFACWTIWAIQANGVGGFVMHIFGPKGETSGALKVLMIVVFLAVGILEVVSIMFRPVSLSFRLYGNIFAGENMLESMSMLIQEPAWLKAVASVVIPIPFYFLEVLVGLVQALVFMLLTSVFTLLICTHEEGHDKKHH